MLNSIIQTLLLDANFDFKLETSYQFDELTLTCQPRHIGTVLLWLKNQKELQFDTLIDLCAVDYLTYGQYDGETDAATEAGYSRGIESQDKPSIQINEPRFAVVYHLLSCALNHRIRVKAYLSIQDLSIQTAVEIWPAANWFEREAYDLYGILFIGHPDLRRLLTDYGFVGHPFRKDFPLSGHVEMRYDASLKRVVYEPVDIEPRILVPKVIRQDNRYLDEKGGN
ncbi:MAG: NADH-quinone oxidoreductase subunit C [Gammaproteobacteria bacterium]|nr:NADH-quinone oxidoreductase subunit C [Gammaproteobacteria bacterium]